MSERYVLGVDVGGTFTDLALIRMSDGHAFFYKTSSTPGDPSIAVADGAAALLESARVAAADVAYFGHGTTVSTNAVIMGKGALTGMVTTEGFRDVLDIRRQRQPDNYNIRMNKPPAPVARHLRRELPERTYISGEPAIEPDLATLDAIISDFETAGVEAIAVCFIHSYARPDHEARVVDAIRKRLPNVFTCASHEVSSEFREFERFSTTVLNASLAPIMSSYLNKLEERAAAMGLIAPKILQSNGGVASAREAGANAVRTLVSGPAAGVTGAAQLAIAAKMPDIITFDVGGTSTDVCLIENGRPLIANQRVIRGFPVRFPMIDVHSVGAGGGSIAWVDSGYLHVGPQSAGADPGPACYDKGGTKPTVTDANVVLGRLPPDALLGGRMPIRADLARRAIEEEVAKPLGLSVEDAAQGVLTILNENMIQAIRVISVEKGYDPRKFVLVAFGGGGALLASDLARELGIETIMVPPHPGLLCAHGLLVADVRADFSMTQISTLRETGASGINEAFAKVEKNVSAWFERENVAPESRGIDCAIDMRYTGQSHELTIPVKSSAFAAADAETLVDTFRTEHERVYGYATGKPMELVTYRVTAKVAMPRPAVPARSTSTDASAGLTGRRQVYFRETNGFVDCPVYDRAKLPAGSEIPGPAIFEQMDTTTVVMPDQTARVTVDGNVLLTFG